MFMTKLGSFNGDTWEDLCQLVFKSKYGSDGYQEMPASPGDFGIEGFTLATGRAFQCYCPDRIYPQDVLLSKQKIKISDDIDKLKKYSDDLSARLGSSKIKDWCFVSPEINHHKLLEHARVKEAEARAWDLGILHAEFTVHLHDADFYLKEINELRSLNGVAITLGTEPTALPALDQPIEIYEQHILRKTKLRVLNDAGAIASSRVDRLYNITLKKFLEHDNFFNTLNNVSPTLYFRLLRLLSIFEQDVEIWQATWTGSSESLTEKITDKLKERILADLQPGVDQSLASQISHHTIARWLAACELDFE
jgi:hypothetical protein